jgi:hypothetical protein
MSGINILKAFFAPITAVATIRNISLHVPTLSAIVAGLRGESSGIPWTTLPTKSAPTSAACRIHLNDF